MKFLNLEKVGPYFNPHETYHYYKLPVCRPKEIQHRPLTLGEVLDGDRMAYSLYNIRFLQNEDAKPLCTNPITAEDVETLKAAIRELYYFEFSIDDLREFTFCQLFEVNYEFFGHISAFPSPMFPLALQDS